MEAELSGYEEGRRSAEKFIALVDKYQNFDELTTYMLNEFVEKIVVHERDRKEALRQLRKWKSILISLENIYRHISVRWK